MSTTFRKHALSLALAGVALLPGAALANYTVKCESVGNRYRYCNANTSGNVRLVDRLSNSGCRQGRDWGYDWNGVWVSNGCRARFEVGGRNTGGGGGGNDAGKAIAAVGGLAILGALIANSNRDDNNNYNYNNNGYVNVPPWAIGSFQGRNPYSGAWETVSIDPNGGVAQYFPGGGSSYGNVQGSQLFMGSQSYNLSPIPGGIALNGASYRRQ